MAEVCDAEVEPDGLVFKASTVKATKIKEDADYAGVRVRFEGMLERVKIPMQIDVGFGDVVVPNREDDRLSDAARLPGAEASGDTQNRPVRDG